MVFVVLKHANTMLNDEEEVDAGQRSEALPNAIKGSKKITAVARPLSVTFMVMVLLRLNTGGETEDESE